MCKDNSTLIDLIDRIRTGYGWGDIGKRVSTKSEPPDSSARKGDVPHRAFGAAGLRGMRVKPEDQAASSADDVTRTSGAFFHQCDLATLYCINKDIKKGKVLTLSHYVHLYFVTHEGKLTTGFAPKGKFTIYRNKL